ncbi:1-acyl-sn-glycerol-3-phosphate acyltransferase gamma-like [Drosophila innubila]|uniref:1-acyl-sn-glycerol-3-phosphate acyltransferase gamma-like n=1 Tax=Drosophila innubila TaxID=198719 RepID=UPI00148C4BD3|nr:1-acyl-sn-glycerol-3-phosphate acyltransferase gamma-like [Drosophila innubila]
MVELEKLKKMTICHMIVAITFFTSGIVCNIAQLLLVILVKPFNPVLFRKLMYYPCYAFYSQLVCVTEWYGGARLRIYMDAETEKYAGTEHGLMIMNHSYEIDWLVAWMMLDKFQCLGTAKAFAKKALGYMPIVGWAWRMAEFVFLNRDFDKDKEIIARQLKIVYSYSNPTWLLLNAEGTRFTPTKHEASVKFAQERGMTVLKHHLIPRTKGFTTSLPTLRGICPAIYDINLVFKKDAKVRPNINSVLSGDHLEPSMFIRRIPLDQVPTDEKAAAEWMQQLYVEKDKIVDSFHETGSFFKQSGFKEVPVRICQPRLSSLLNFAVIALATNLYILYYLVSSLLAANYFGLTTAILVLGLFFLLLRKVSNMSKISKASTYGAAEGKPKSN